MLDWGGGRQQHRWRVGRVAVSVLIDGLQCNTKAALKS